MLRLISRASLVLGPLILVFGLWLAKEFTGREGLPAEQAIFWFFRALAYLVVAQGAFITFAGISDLVFDINYARRRRANNTTSDPAVQSNTAAAATTVTITKELS